MNLAEIRTLARVAIAISDATRAREISDQISLSEYKIDSFYSLNDLCEEAAQNPPGVVIFHYEDVSFFQNGGGHKNVIEKINLISPDIKIIFICSLKTISRAFDLFEQEIYDCIVWPQVHPHQLLRALDRAAQSHMKTRLELLKQSDLVRPNHQDDLAIFAVWLKILDKCDSYDKAIELWMNEAARVMGVGNALYLKYIENKKTLALVNSIGFKIKRDISVGIDLEAEEPGFNEFMLERPEKIFSLRKFVQNGMGADQAIYYKLKIQNQVRGIFVFLARPGQLFTNQHVDNSYVQLSLEMLRRHFEILKMREHLSSSAGYDFHKNVLRTEHFVRRLREEITRARRLLRPVALLRIVIDKYPELELKNSTTKMQGFLFSIAELLMRQSRINDFVGYDQSGHFLVCLPHTDKLGAAIKAERLRRYIEASDVTEVLSAGEKITVSTGMSEYPSICHDADGFMQTAEMAYFDIRKSSYNEIRLAVPPLHFEPDFIAKDFDRAESALR